MQAIMHGSNDSGECENNDHTVKVVNNNNDSVDVLKLPRIVLRDDIMREWFSINSTCYSSLLALRFRLLCLRLYVYKNGRNVPDRIRNYSTFDINLDYDEYQQLFINENQLRYDNNGIIGDIMYLFCYLMDDSNDNEKDNIEWITFLGIELFSMGYSLEDEKAFWYITINECNNNTEYTLPDNKRIGWVKKVLDYKSGDTSKSCNNSNIIYRSKDSGFLNTISNDNSKNDYYYNGNINNNQVNYIMVGDCNSSLNNNENSAMLAFYNNLFKRNRSKSGNGEFDYSNSLNPVNHFLDFVIISIFELLINPKYNDHNILFKYIECDPILLSKIRLGSDYQKLSRCSQIWSGQHIAYRCLTCGITTSSCICVDCFQNGNHEDHDYYIYKSDYGGCCDCGDEQAWDKNGFCKEHSENVDSSSLNCRNGRYSVDDVVIRRLKGLFHGILCHIILLSRLHCTIPDTRELFLPFHSKLISNVIEKNKSDVTEEGVEGTHFLLEGELLQDSENNTIHNNINNNVDNINNNVNQNAFNTGNIINQIQHQNQDNVDQDRNQVQVRIQFQVQNIDLQRLGEFRIGSTPNLVGDEFNNNASGDGNFNVNINGDSISYDNRNDVNGSGNNSDSNNDNNNSNGNHNTSTEANNGASNDEINVGNNDENNNTNANIGLENARNYPVVFVLKQEKSFQMDSYFFQWFICLTENYQSVFLPLLGELLGSEVSSLFFYERNKENRNISKILINLVENRFGKDKKLLNNGSIRELLSYLHPEFTVNRVSSYIPFHINSVIDDFNQEENFSNLKRVRNKDMVTYLDVFWMKWSQDTLNDEYSNFIDKLNRQNDLTDLLLILMFDKEFKEVIFPIIFMRNYNELVMRQEKVLTRIAVQLFTIDKLLVEMTFDCDLIKIIFYTTFQILGNCIGYYDCNDNLFNTETVLNGEISELVSDKSSKFCNRTSYHSILTNYILPTIHSYGNNSIINRRYIYPMHDYKYILQSIDLIAFIFLNKCTVKMQKELIKRKAEKEDYYTLSQKYYMDLWHNGWLALLRLVQCINPHNDQNNIKYRMYNADNGNLNSNVNVYDLNDDSANANDNNVNGDYYFTRRVNRYLEDIRWRSSLLLSCDIQSTVDILLQIMYILIGDSGRDIYYFSYNLSSDSELDSYDNTNSFGVYRITINTFQSLVQWFYITTIKEKWNLKYSFIENVAKLDYIKSEYQPVKHFLLFELTQEVTNYADYFLHDHCVMDNSVSIHIPLHRITTQIVFIYLGYFNKYNLNKDLDYIKNLLSNIGLNSDLLKILLIEHPIRSYCFFFQTYYFNQQFSIRNGSNRTGESQFYRKSHWSILYMITDLISIRFYVNILDDERYILLLFNSILTHFDVKNKLTMDKRKSISMNGCISEDLGNEFSVIRENNNIGEVEKKSEKDSSLSEESKFKYEFALENINIFNIGMKFNSKMASCMHFIMDILTKINSVDIPVSLTFNKSIYRYLLLQYLIRKERSRSEIQDGVPISSSASLYYGQFIQSINSSNPNLIVDEILCSFCDAIPANDKKPILYKIKQPLGWMLYDPVLPINFSNEKSSLSFTKFMVNKMCNWYENNKTLVQENLINKSGYMNNQTNGVGLGKVDSIEKLHKDADKVFIDNKFVKFPMKLCHISEANHFVSLFNYNNNNVYILSALFSSVVHLYLPKLLGINKNETVIADPRTIQYSFILIFNLINIEIIKFVNSLRKKESDFDNVNLSQLDDIFEYKDINTHFLSNNSVLHSEKTTVKELNPRCINVDLVENYFGISKEDNDDFENKQKITIMGYTEEMENDYYNYLLVSPYLCNLVYDNFGKKSDLRKAGLDNTLIIKELNIDRISEQLKANQIENIFNLLTVPIKIDLKGIKEQVEVEGVEMSQVKITEGGEKREFCLMDILIEAIYSIRTKESDDQLFLNKENPDSKFRFVNRDLLNDISLEACYFLEWGLSIGKEASPEIREYINKYLDSIYLGYKQEKRKVSDQKNNNKDILSQQASIMQRYLNKQKEFMKNHRQTFENNDESETSNMNSKAEYCVFCHEEINILSSDNIDDLATFGYLDLQTISMNSRKNVKSFSSINGSYSLPNYTSMLTTICGHIIHYSCIGQYYKSFIENNFFTTENLTITQFLRDNNINHYNLNGDGNYSDSGSNSNSSSSSSSDLDTSSNSDSESSKSIEYKYNSLYGNVPIIPDRGMIRVLVDTYGDDAVIHELSSVKLDESNEDLKSRVLDYKTEGCFYHYTNLYCPYCKTNSNIILPFKSCILGGRKAVGCENGEKKDENDGLSELLERTLNTLKDLSLNKDSTNYMFYFEHLNVSLKKYPTLQQILSILNSFNYLLPHNLISNKIYINSVLNVNPISIFVKILSDNIIIDNISFKDNNCYKPLFYSIIIDSIKNLIKSFPTLGESLLRRLSPVLNNSNSNMDIWDFVSLQSPSSRFQFLLNYIILTEFVGEKDGKEGKQNYLDMSSIITIMLVIEVFSLVWTFWNSDWNEKFRELNNTGKRGNVIVDLILKYSNRDKSKVISNCFLNKDEFSVLNFCNELLNGCNFNMIIKHKRKGKVEYRATRVNSINKTRIFTNSYGSIPIQISKPFRVFAKRENPDDSFVTSFNDFSESEQMDQQCESDDALFIDYKNDECDTFDESIPEHFLNDELNLKYGAKDLHRNFQIDGCYDKSITGGVSHNDGKKGDKYEYNVGDRGFNFEKEYIRDNKTYYQFSDVINDELISLDKISYILNEQIFPNYNITSECDLRIDDISLNKMFKLENIEKLPDIVYYGILPWLKCLSKFQDIFLDEYNGDDDANLASIKLEMEQLSVKDTVIYYTEKISNKLNFKCNVFMNIIELLVNFEHDNRNNYNTECEQANELVNSIVNNILFIKILPLKRVFLPLTTLDVLVHSENYNTETQLLNKNINTYYRVINNSELDFICKKFSYFNDKYLCISNFTDNIILINSYNQNNIALPKMYHTLYNKLISNQIRHWSGSKKPNINQLLLCLSCGAVLCTDYSCCNESEVNSVNSSLFLRSYYYCRKDDNNNSDINKHSCYSIPYGTGLNMSFTSIPIKDHITRCGNGLSFFLHISSSIVICFRIDIASTKNAGSNNIFNWIEPEKFYIYLYRACEFSTLYIDEYGEEDRFLSRGKPLTLCRYRLSKLQNSIQKYLIKRDSSINWYPFQNNDSLNYFPD